ncbi:MAG: hypothetical protein R3C52_06695 [Hyphomonadaceae bacterium]
MLTSSQRLANTALARSGALVEPNPQERTNDRRSLGDASDALRSAIAVIDAARLQSSTGNAGNLSNADISATYVARGKVELLLAGYEGAASRPDFGCASGAGDPNRVDTALQSFNSALRDSGLSGAIAADAYAGRGCALQASSAMDAYARSAQLSDAETSFSQALNVDPSTSKTRRYLDLGRAQMALASHQKSINSSQYTATLDRAVKTFKDAILPNPQNRPNISRENAATLIATADAYADLGDDAQRHEALVRASQEDPNLARAIYEHGRMHYDAFSEARLAGRGPSTSSYPNETGLSDSSLALDLLSSAAAKGSSTGDVKTEALALYYASKVMIEGGLSRPNLDAVEMAGDALSKVNTWENRQQACLSRIWRGDGTGRVRLLTGSSPPAQLARNVCEAGEERPEAYLMRGLYHIRLSHYGGAENQLDNLEGAQLAFRTGTQMLSELPTSGAENVERIERLRAEFEVAQARVERCLNQERLSDQRLLDMDQVRRVKAEKYFATYNVNQCNR